MPLSLPASLTQTDAMAFLRQCPPSPSVNTANSTAPWVVDASATEHFDSATLAVLMDLKRQAQTAGVAFSVQGASPSLLELARVYGVAEWLMGVK